MNENVNFKRNEIYFNANELHGKDDSFGESAIADNCQTNRFNSVTVARWLAVCNRTLISYVKLFQTIELNGKWKSVIGKIPFSFDSRLFVQLSHDSTVLN